MSNLANRDKMTYFLGFILVIILLLGFINIFSIQSFSFIIKPGMSQDFSKTSTAGINNVADNSSLISHTSSYNLPKDRTMNHQISIEFVVNFFIASTPATSNLGNITKLSQGYGFAFYREDGILFNHYYMKSSQSGNSSDLNIHQKFEFNPSSQDLLSKSKTGFLIKQLFFFSFDLQNGTTGYVESIDSGIHWDNTTTEKIPDFPDNLNTTINQQDIQFWYTSNILLEPVVDLFFTMSLIAVILLSQLVDREINEDETSPEDVAN